MLGSGLVADLGPVCRGASTRHVRTSKRQSLSPFGDATGPPWITDRLTATDLDQARDQARCRRGERSGGDCETRRLSAQQDQHRGFEVASKPCRGRPLGDDQVNQICFSRAVIDPPLEKAIMGGRRVRKAVPCSAGRVLGFRSFARHLDRNA
jgi:hypothetical protein